MEAFTGKVTLVEAFIGKAVYMGKVEVSTRKVTTLRSPCIRSLQMQSPHNRNYADTGNLYKCSLKASARGTGDFHSGDSHCRKFACGGLHHVHLHRGHFFLWRISLWGYFLCTGKVLPIGSHRGSTHL